MEKESSLLLVLQLQKNLVERIMNVGFDTYWWAPLVDNPEESNSLTRKMVKETNLPAMNTGGTVGTAAWIFALSKLKISNIAVVGMDLGYYSDDTSYFQTQTYECLIDEVGEENIEDYFPEFTYPTSGESFYIDPTYYWYRKNMLDLISSSGSLVYNCTGGGTLIGPGVKCIELEDFFELTN